jgi:hypothetical protein
MLSQSRRVGTGHDVFGKAIDLGDPKPVKKPKRWKQFLLTVSAVYPLTLLIPGLLGVLSHLVPLLREAAIRGILAAVLLVASLVFVINPLFNRVFKTWINS